MDFCVERLARGEWVHIFPEGRVNVEKEHIRFKWGVGRLVADSAARGRPPVVLPVWHEGMDCLLPNVEPYRLRIRNRLHLVVGEPLRLHPLLDRYAVSSYRLPNCYRQPLLDRYRAESYRRNSAIAPYILTPNSNIY